MDSVCLFCDHALDGRSRKFCTTCLPPRETWGDIDAYNKRATWLDRHAKRKSQPSGLCLFCCHALNGRSKKFCTTCLPPYSEWPDRAAYAKRYNDLYRACNLHPEAGYPSVALPLDHKGTWTECLECGELCQRYAYGQPNVCSDDCRTQRRKRRSRDAARRRYVPVERKPRPCAWCYTQFTPNTTVTTFCSAACSTKLRKQVELWRSPNSCPLPVCIDCFQVFGAGPNNSGKLNNGNRCRTCRQATSNQQLRRVAKLKGDGPTLERLAERDGWRCHICNRMTNPKATDRIRKPTIDHLVPIAVGGEDTMRNTAIACWSCNASRGTGGQAQLRLIG